MIKIEYYICYFGINNLKTFVIISLIMQVLRISELPDFLMDSQLVKQLTNSDNQTIPCATNIDINSLINPENKKLIVNNANFDKIMDLLRYFMVDTLPWEIYDYIMYFDIDETNKHDYDLNNDNLQNFYSEIKEPLVKFEHCKPNNILKYYDFHFDELEIIIEYKILVDNDIKSYKEKSESDIFFCNDNFDKKILEKLTCTEYPQAYSPIHRAISRGCLNLVRYFHNFFSKLYDEPFEVEKPVIKNRKEREQYYEDDSIEKFSTGFNYYALNSACFGNGNVNKIRKCLEYVFKYGFNLDGCETDDWFNTFVRDCCTEGNLEILDCLIKNNCPWDSSAFSESICNGNINCLKYMYNHAKNCFSRENIKAFLDKFSFNSEIVECSYYSSYEICIDTCIWDYGSIVSAIRIKQNYYEDLKFTDQTFECIKYAHQNGCPIHCSQPNSKHDYMRYSPILYECVIMDRVECFEYFYKNIQNCKCYYCKKDNRQYAYEQIKEDLESGKLYKFVVKRLGKFSEIAKLMLSKYKREN